MTDKEEQLFFDGSSIADAIVELKVEGNTFECLLCGQEHELNEEGWKTEEGFFNLPMKTFICSKNIYYVFSKTDDGIVNFIMGLDTIQTQDGEEND